MSGTIVNIDANLSWFFMSSLDEDYVNLEEKAKEYIELYRDSGITDLLFCIFEQSSITRTQVLTTRGDNYFKTEENGVPVDYVNLDRIALLHKLDELGVDLMGLWLRHTKEMGIHPWITIRMNDAHFHGGETAFLRGDLYYEAMEKGWFIGPEKYGSYFGTCFNYAVPEIRRRMLDYIREQLDRYDVDGLELDFQREMMCFDVLNQPDCCNIMNGFISNVRTILRDAEEKWGHPISLMIRLARDPDQCKAMGFDALYWAEHGLVDAVVPAPRWGTTDSDMPIARWVELMEPYGVKVYAGLEINVLRADGISRTTLEISKAHTVQYSDQGSDKIYLHNFFSEADAHVNGTPLKKIWQVCADPDLAAKGERRYVVTRQDDSFCDIHNADLPRGWKPLPQEVNGEFTFEIKTGPVNTGDVVTLYVGADGEYTVSVNGIPAEVMGAGEDAYVTRSPVLEPGTVTAFRVIPTGSHTQNVTVRAHKAMVRYLELKVDGK